MEIQRLYFVIADISGYTRFVTSHKQSLLHAEKIVGNLLEAVMSEVHAPLKVHELLGDAVTMYAPAETDQPLAEQIFAQMHRMHTVFKETESNHISNCSLCVCEACANVDKLRLKIIAHTGEAAFTTVGGMPKISGEEVILTSLAKKQHSFQGIFSPDRRIRSGTKCRFPERFYPASGNARRIGPENSILPESQS
jgi:hypothetical protein